MAKFNNSQLVLLDELSGLYNLFCIIDTSGTFEPEIYISGEFVTPTLTNPYLSLRVWIRITLLINESSLFVNSNNSLSTIKDQIDILKVTNKERKFDNTFKWLKF